MGYTSEQETKTMRKAKRQLFELFGNECRRCGFSDVRALQIDHKKGGGGVERQKSGNRRWLYRKLLRNEYATLKTYQLLCANCNWIKRWLRGENQLNEKGRT